MASRAKEFDQEDNTFFWGGLLMAMIIGGGEFLAEIAKSMDWGVWTATVTQFLLAGGIIFKRWRTDYQAKAERKAGKR